MNGKRFSISSARTGLPYQSFAQPHTPVTIYYYLSSASLPDEEHSWRWLLIMVTETCVWHSVWIVCCKMKYGVIDVMYHDHAWYQHNKLLPNLALLSCVMNTLMIEISCMAKTMTSTSCRSPIHTDVICSHYPWKPFTFLKPCHC